MSDRHPHCRPVAQIWRDGGYFDAVMSAGAELERVRQYVLAFAGERPGATGLKLQQPGYPMFPGLHHAPFRNLDAAPGAALLEAAFPVIRDECLALRDDEYLVYTPPSMANLWAVHLFSHMGVDTERLTGRCPKTNAVIRALPRVCLDYPWGDALFSVHASDAHLKPHCSIDNLRVRCHLGLTVPPGCEMRVGTEVRQWREGRTLLFEDSFEHEVWNRGAARRAILIVDFWHPDLAAIEIEALTAGFRKSEVRRVFLLERLAMAHGARAMLTEALETALAHEDAEPLLRKYWRV